jgi:hypothetical protein
VAHNVHVDLGTVERLQASRGQYAVAWTRRSEPKGSVTEGIQLRKVGKKAAGRALDGVTHDARPIPRAA